MKANLKKIIVLTGCAVALVGCAQQQNQHNTTPPAATSAPTSAPAKSGTVSAYFPSGKADGSGLLVEKSAPAQVLVGQPFEYTYKVSNLTDTTLENVSVSDRVTGAFTMADSDPKPTVNANGIATWNVGSLGAKESKTITVTGASMDEGSLITCGWATYTPVACQDIRVVKAHITLSKSQPADALIGDVIPVTLTVKNSGSSALTGVQIAEALPDGLTSSNRQNLTFDVGSLAPGESRDFNYNVTAANVGVFTNLAKVTSAEGISAEAAAVMAIRQPILAITCQPQDKQYEGREFKVDYIVANTGDAPAANTTVSLPISTGLTVNSVSDNGQVKDGVITWSLGTLAANASKKVNAAFIAATAGDYPFNGIAKATGAETAASDCSTKVIGVAAVLLEKSDNSDPVAVDDTTTYTVKVTNQGSAEVANVAIHVEIAPELLPISTSIGSAIISNQTVYFATLPKLAAKQAVTYTIKAKGVKAGDAHTKFILNTATLKSPISAEESTTVY